MIVIDSEFQSLIPPLSDDEYERLEKSIVAEGVRDPIITWNGTIIDGHNRYNICEEHGVKCPQVERQFPSREAAKIWIIENQFGRRNLNPYQRSVLALQLEPLYAAEAKRRQATSTGGAHPQLSQKSDEAVAPIRTDEQLAKLAGTSRDTIRKVKIIETEAESGNETAIEAREAVKSGKKSIHMAYTEVRPKANKADTRPICTVCGRPIDAGDSYGHNPFKHRSCAIADNEAHRGIRGGYVTPRSMYSNADRDLQENVPTYTVLSLVDELVSSLNEMKASMEESLKINSEMGVTVPDRKKMVLFKAIDNVFKAIEDIKGE